MPDLSFVLVAEPVYPDPAALVGAAGELGIPLTAAPAEGEGPLAFELANGGSLMIMLVSAPHPDAPHLPRGPLSPPPEELSTARAHYIVTALGLEGDAAEKDVQMLALTAAVIGASPAVAAMLGHGMMFYSADLFADFAAMGAEQRQVPIEIAVDVTAAAESEDTMSFLTHGMQRYGREELFVHAPIRGKGALDFLFGLMRWLTADPGKHLPTGDTIGRDEDERIVIHRVPSPTGEGPSVIRLDLPR